VLSIVHFGNRRFSTLPRALRGSAATRRISRGTLKPAIWRLQKATSAASSSPGSATRKATGTSPQSEWGRPATAASRTPGKAASTSSTSRG
jgi:hypothetical protein